MSIWPTQIVGVTLGVNSFNFVGLEHLEFHHFILAGYMMGRFHGQPWWCHKELEGLPSPIFHPQDQESCLAGYTLCQSWPHSFFLCGSQGITAEFTVYAYTQS